MTLAELTGKRILILGYGPNHHALVTFLVGQGMKLTIRDRKPELAEAFTREHPDLTDKVSWEVLPDILTNLHGFEVLFRSPSINVTSPALQKAVKAGAILTSQTKLFFDLCPAGIIGITGTKGKGTTSSLTYAILKAGYTNGDVYLGGNIGLDPFSFFTKLREEDLVVLELSSFQLEDLHKGPEVAVVLRVTADHLDVHGSLPAYRQAKLQLLLGQGEEDTAIVNTEDPGMEWFAAQAPGRVIRYAKYQPQRNSGWVDIVDGREVLYLQLGEGLQSFDISDRQLVGAHNLENIIPAALVGSLYGVPMEKIRDEILAFTGLPHRLQVVGKYHEVRFYDDSIATTPESCRVAVEAFAGQRVHLVLGGNTKGSDTASLADFLVATCCSISLLPGTATKTLLPQLRKAVARTKSGCLILDQAREPLMETVLSGIQPHVQAGDVVLLAPAATSFASFSSYSERGERFAQAVHARYGEKL